MGDKVKTYTVALKCLNCLESHYYKIPIGTKFPGFIKTQKIVCKSCGVYLSNGYEQL